MARLAHFIVSRSRLVLAGTAITTLLAVVALTQITFNADVSAFLLEGNPAGEEFARIQEKYETADPINVLASLPDGETFLDVENLASLAELREGLESVDGVSGVASVLPEVNPVTGDRLDPGSIRDLPPGAGAQLLERSPISEILVSEDGRHSMLLVSPESDATGTARRVIATDHPDFEIAFSGNPVVFASVLDQLSFFLLLIPPLVIILLVAVFYTTIGSRKLSALAILPAVLGSLWTFGLVSALGVEIDIVTVIVPIFVIVMGSADGLHFVTHFQEEAARTDDQLERTESALRQIGVPMILTTVSTSAGFLSLLVTDVQPIRQLGLFTAVGIGFAGLISLLTLPALMTHVDPSTKRAAPLGPRLVRSLRAAIKTRLPALAVTAGVLVFAALTVPGLEVNPDQLFFFKDDDPVRLAFERTEEIFGGATPLTGEFSFDSSDPQGSLEAAGRAGSELEQLDGVRRVISLADLASAFPPDQIDRLLDGSMTTPLGQMVSEDGLRFVLMPENFTTADLEGWLAYAGESDVVDSLTGMPVVWDEIADLVLEAQAQSLVVAFLLVALMLGLTYRRVRETLISLVPIALTIVTLLGFIAISGIQLNLLTAVVSSIVIGVGIDYAIHYMAAIDHARTGGDGYALRAVSKAGRPIVANALGIAVALTALWLSPLKVHAQVSQIMWVAMATAAATSLLVIPALLPRKAVSETSPS